MHKSKINQKQLEDKIYQSLGLQQVDEKPGLDRTKQEMNTQTTAKQLTDLKDQSQRKRKRIKDMLGSSIAKNNSYDVSEEMKDLEWRLEVLRNDRKQRINKNKNSSQQMTFDQLYNRQKNKYAKFRQRSKIKINDPKYLDMIGSTLMRREKRKLNGMEKIEKHIQSLDTNIKNHSMEAKNGKRNKF